MYRKVGLVFAGPQHISKLVQDLRELGGMVLADGEYQALAKLAGHWITQTVLDEGLAKKLIGRFGEKLLLEVLGDKALFLLAVFTDGGHHGIALLG